MQVPKRLIGTLLVYSCTMAQILCMRSLHAISFYLKNEKLSKMRTKKMA